MSIQNISIKNILVEESRFSIKDFLFFKSIYHETCAGESFKRLGILNPVVVYRDSKRQFHLIDGEKRIYYAKQKQMETIKATVFTETLPVTDIIVFILCDKRNEIELSIMNRVQFICFALSSGIPESWVLDSLCIQFGFKPYKAFLRDCKRMNNLPAELRLFCHKKRFSLKQILNLTFYPKDILLQLIAWKSILHLTASTLDEIASNMKDYLKSKNKTIKDFLSDPDVREIVRSSLSSRDKTEKLRQIIHIKHFPVLSETNAKIQKTVQRLNLPKAISINWDKNLENKNVGFIINVQVPAKWTELLEILNSTETKNAIETILEEL